MEDIMVSFRMKWVEDLEDILQCPVCWEVRKGLIYTCTNGHHICEECKQKNEKVNNFLCIYCESKYNGSRNFIAEEISAKFPDMMSSLLEPNHYTNRKIEKKCVETQTDEWIMSKIVTPMQAADTQTETVIEVIDDSDNDMDVEECPETSNADRRKSSSSSIVVDCIIKNCQHKCIKKDMVKHVKKEHNDLIEMSRLENKCFAKTWNLSFESRVMDFVLNMKDLNIFLHLHVLIDDQECLSGEIQMLKTDAKRKIVEMQYVISIINPENSMIFEPFKGKVPLFQDGVSKPERIFISSQFLRKVLLGKNEKFDCQLTLFCI